MAQASFLSVRVPAETRARIKAAAAERGQSVQDLVGALIDRFLVEADRQPPTLPAILAGLRAHAPELRARGVRRLWVFGSVARGTAGPASDVDLIAEIDPDARLSMTGFVSLRANLAELLRRPVDLAEWNLLREPVRARARAEAVQVF